LQQAAQDAQETEDSLLEPAAPKEDVPLETAGFDPVEFQLANGNDVRIVFARFWERIRYQDWREGAKPARYYAIKIYSTEGILSRHMVTHCEFRGGKDFAFLAVPKIWEWLDALVESRGHAKYDWLEEFIEDFADQLNQLSDAAEDAVEHIQHLPELAYPQAFDHEDDSIFNDQNEDSTKQDK
jgi:hypothetical protein